MARTRRSTLSGRKPAPPNWKKPPVLEEDDEMQLKPWPKQIVTNIVTRNDQNNIVNDNLSDNENENDNIDNDSSNGKLEGVEEVEDMQIDLQVKHDDNTKTKTCKRSIPTYCETSISTSATSSTAENGLASLCDGASLISDKPGINKLNLTRVSNKVTTSTTKNVPYKNDKPLDTLTLTETTIAIQRITKDIFPTCQFTAQPNHADSIIWYILHKLGYHGAHHDKDHSRRWHATWKIVIETITKL